MLAYLEQGIAEVVAASCRAHGWAWPCPPPGDSEGDDLMPATAPLPRSRPPRTTRRLVLEGETVDDAISAALARAQDTGA